MDEVKMEGMREEGRKERVLPLFGTID